MNILERPRRLGPSRPFKRNRRRGLKKAAAGMKEARFGCAYTPAWKEIHQAYDLLEIAREKCSVKNWGR